MSDWERVKMVFVTAAGRRVNSLINGKPQASSTEFAYAYGSPLNEDAQDLKTSTPAAGAELLTCKCLMSVSVWNVTFQI